MINKWKKQLIIMRYRSSHPEVFLGKCVLKICNRFTGEHPCRSTISIKLLHNFFEIALLHGCSSVNLLHIFRAPFPKNTSGRLLLEIFGGLLTGLSKELDVLVMTYFLRN